MNHEKSIVSARERELLLLRARTGDQEALNVLFESCRGRLYGQALRILARPQDAEDAVQEAMLAAFTHLHRFQRRADFLTWTTRIVINAALQDIRKTRTRPTVPWDQIDSEGASFSEYVRDPSPLRNSSSKNWNSRNSWRMRCSNCRSKCVERSSFLTLRIR